MDIKLKIGDNVSILSLKGGELQLMIEIPPSMCEVKKGQDIEVMDSQGKLRMFHVNYTTNPQGGVECVLAGVTVIPEMKEPVSGIAQKIKDAQKKHNEKDFKDEVYDQPRPEPRPDCGT